MNDKQALKDLLNDLDRSVNQLSWHGILVGILAGTWWGTWWFLGGKREGNGAE